MPDQDQSLNRRIADQLQALLELRQAPGDELNLWDEGLLDSIRVLKINVILQEAFGADIPPEELRPENYQDVAAIAGLCRRYMSD